MMPSFPLAEKTATLTLQRKKDVEKYCSGSVWNRAGVMTETIALLDATAWSDASGDTRCGVEWWYSYPQYIGRIWHYASFFDTKAVYSGFLATVKLNISEYRYRSGTGAYNVAVEPMTATTDGLGGTYATTRTATGDFTFSDVRLSRYLRVSLWITNWDFPTTEDIYDDIYSYFKVLNTLKYTITGV
jgi:hypothetical protein